MTTPIPAAPVAADACRDAQIIALPPVYPDEQPPAQDRLRPCQRHPDWLPEPGDVFKTSHGNFLLVIDVDHRGETKYLTFDRDGTCRSPGRTGPCWLQGKPLVGRVQLPTLMVEPINA